MSPTSYLNHLQLDHPLAVLDTETTGLDTQSDRIVEIGIVRLEPNRPARTYRRLVHPGIAIPPAASAVHGITDADVVDMPPFAELLPEIDRFLSGCDLAGFNLVRFDLPLLAAEYRRAGWTFGVQGRNIVDVLQLHRRLNPSDLGSVVRQYLDCEHTEAHGALADAVATVAVLDAQLGRHPELPRQPWALHEQLYPVDVAGCFRLAGDQLVFGFGKYRGQPLEVVAARDPGYLRWMLNQGFLDDVQALVTAALADQTTVSGPPSRR